jgi:hypothetical protein
LHHTVLWQHHWRENHDVAAAIMKRCTDALTWFPQVGLGLVQRRQSRGLGLAAGRQRGRSSSRSRPPARRRRWRCRCRRTGATADDVFQAARRVRPCMDMDGREAAAKMMPNKQACIRIRSSSGFFQGKRIITTTIRN